MNSKDLFLLTILFILATTERSMELVVRPFSQVYYYSHMDYFIELYMRIMRSSYLIPSITISSYLLIKTTDYVLDFGLYESSQVKEEKQQTSIKNKTEEKN